MTTGVTSFSLRKDVLLAASDVSDVLSLPPIGRLSLRAFNTHTKSLERRSFELKIPIKSEKQIHLQETWLLDKSREQNALDGKCCDQVAAKTPTRLSTPFIRRGSLPPAGKGWTGLISPDYPVSLKNPENKVVANLFNDGVIDTATTPTLPMDWEYFQDLEQWVNIPEFVVQPSAAMAYDTGESLTSTRIATGHSESVHLNQPLLLDPDDDLDATIWKQTSTDVFSAADNRELDTTTIDILTPPTLLASESVSCDDIEHSNNALSNLIDNNQLVNGIINSSNIDDNENVNNTSVVFNLDIIDDVNNTDKWHKYGLKTSTSKDVMLSSANTFVPKIVSVNSNSNLSPSSYSQSINETLPIATTKSTFESITPTSSYPINKLEPFNFDKTLIDEKEVIRTPDVISTVLSFKKDEFDLLAYINDETDILENKSTTSRRQSLKRPLSSNNDNVSSKKLSPKKAKTTDLSSLQSTPVSSPTIAPVRRGRPPKSRVNSVSSDDVDGSKYRELRDKNNEASRRSRINRKLREAQIEQEAIVLERENVRLTAKVKELDQLVSRMKQALLTTVLKSSK